MNQPIVSVLVVTYQQAPYIERSIQSVLDQDLPYDFEVVVADDASTDGTAEIVRRFAAGDPRVKPIFREQNVGPGCNLVSAYRHCSGEFVALLEGDDYWTDCHKLASQVDAMREHPYWSLCFHRVAYVDVRGDRLPTIFPEQVPEPYGLAEVAERLLIPTGSILFRRDLLPAIPEEFGPLLPCDWPLCILLAERGELGFLPVEMAAYRVHGGGVWSSQSIGARSELVLSMLLAVQDLVRPEHIPLIRKSIQAWFAPYAKLATTTDKLARWRVTAPLRWLARYLLRR